MFRYRAVFTKPIELSKPLPSVRITLPDGDKLKILKPTARCVMTILPQGDLPQDLNVLRALAKHNKGNFGVYEEVIETGLVKVGDKVTVL